MAGNQAPYIYYHGTFAYESEPIGGKAYKTLDIRDYEGDAFTFELIGQRVERRDPQADGSFAVTTETADNFALVGNEIRSTKVFDFDADGFRATQIVTIRAVDSAGNERVQDIHIFVGDVEETFNSFGTTFTATLGADNVIGNRKAESLYGLEGNDHLYGEGGNDRLYGGGSADILEGGRGNDMLYGGLSSDQLYGGQGADRFVFKSISESTKSNYDYIQDLSAKEGDKIDLSFADADINLAGRQDFEFIGNTKYSGTAGELRYQKLSYGTFIAADVDGDGRSDFQVRIEGASKITDDYFLF